MGMWQDLEDLMEMFSEGGSQVVTLVADSENITALSTPSSAYQGKNYDRRGIRTTIQFDSDYVTILSPEVLAMPDLWQRHTDALQAKLSILQRMHLLIEKSLFVFFILAPIIYMLISYLTGGFPGEWLALIGSGLAVAIACARKWIVRVLLLPAILRVARWQCSDVFSGLFPCRHKG